MRCGCGECVYEWYMWFRSSTGDVLVRGVGGVCGMCLARGGVGWRGR